MFRKRKKSMRPFEFMYRGTLVVFNPEDLHIAITNNIDMFVNGEKVPLTIEEAMQFAQSYCRWLDQN